MSQMFDPYLKWLGIRDPQRPPNHYRLLGLELFEQDTSVIALAADRQMAQIRHFQAGEQAAHAERILNELATARLCLLKPERHAQYDQGLRASLASVAALRPTQPVARATPVAGVPVAMTARSPAPQAHALPDFVVAQTATSTFPAKRTSSLGIWLALGGVTLVCGILIAVLASRSPNAGGESTAKLPEEKAPPSGKPALQPTAQTKTVSTKISPEPKTITKESSGNESTQAKTDSTTRKIQTAPLESQIGNTALPVKSERNPREMPLIGELPSSSKSADPQQFTELAAEDAKRDPPANSDAGTDPQAIARGIPDKSSLIEKEKEIRELFKEEFASRDPKVKSEFADQLLKTARETANDRALRYVLLISARDLGAGVGNIATTFGACENIAQDYDVDVTDDQIAATTKLQSVAGRPPEYYRELLMKISELVSGMQARDDYDSAMRLTNIAQNISRKLGDQATIQNLTALNKELLQAKTQFLKVKAARETLKTSPNDPAANTAWGEYLCFIKGNSAEGLAYLAKGDDSALSATAKKTLAGPKTTDDKLALGDEWWSLSEKEKDSIKSGMREQAGIVYQEIFPELKGIAATKVEKRLKEIQADTGGRTPDAEFRRLLLSTTWKILWHSPPGTDVLKFLPNGTSENYVFVRWELARGVLTISAKPDDALKRYAQIQLVNGKYLVNYFEKGRTNTGIFMPDSPMK